MKRSLLTCACALALALLGAGCATTGGATRSVGPAPSLNPKYASTLPPGPVLVLPIQECARSDGDSAIALDDGVRARYAATFARELWKLTKQPGKAKVGVFPERRRLCDLRSEDGLAAPWQVNAAIRGLVGELFAVNPRKHSVLVLLWSPLTDEHHETGGARTWAVLVAPDGEVVWKRHSADCPNASGALRCGPKFEEAPAVVARLFAEFPSKMKLPPGGPGGSIGATTSAAPPPRASEQARRATRPEETD